MKGNDLDSGGSIQNRLRADKRAHRRALGFLGPAFVSVLMKGASALADSRTNAVPAVEIPPPPQIWNIHGQNTDIVQGYPAFPAQYSGPNSLRDGGQTRETVSLDLLAGVRLWSGAEAHVDGLMWQGFGVGQTLGVESYPNGEAFRLGTEAPNVNFTRVFIRQTIGMGGDTQTVADDALDLAGKVNVSRLVLTVGRFSAKDIFDNNSYANDPRTQFMSWGLMANEAWDYPADALGFTTGLAIELYQPNWAWRYGFFQVPDDSNGTAMDGHVLDAWGMVTELERDYSLVAHPGVVRLLGYLNRAQMGSYAAALSEPGTDIIATRTFRSKYGVGLNAEQEIIKNVGVFTRLGWSDGQHEAWNFSDVDYTITGGVSVKGAAWHRPDDTVGLAGVCNGITRTHQEYLAAGGSGVLAGDGRLRYGWEKSVETYYDVQIWKTLHASVDYQYVTDPAFNQARGPISFFGGRVHWEF